MATRGPHTARGVAVVQLDRYAAEQPTQCQSPALPAGITSGPVVRPMDAIALSALTTGATNASRDDSTECATGRGCLNASTLFHVASHQPRVRYGYPRSSQYALRMGLTCG